MSFSKYKRPRLTTSKKDDVCLETGKEIKAGEQCIYSPHCKGAFALGTEFHKCYLKWVESSRKSSD